MQNPALRPSRHRLERPVSARFRSECRGSICILHVTGVVDTVNAPELEEAIERVAREHRGDVLVSFVHCELADGFALRVLLKAAESLGSRLFVVADRHGRLSRLLELTLLTARVPVYPTLPAAFFDLSSDPTRSLGDVREWAPRSA
jgi:anti-anti-sigma factor